MSAKENAAVGQLLELLESRYALRVLWALKDGHPQTFRLLQDIGSHGPVFPGTFGTGGTCGQWLIPSCDA